ncbi:MAG: tetratricopeptide repeat protein [Treponema sp.]|nr:tetratricopeptide repeat protein [Treponema sp.]
MERVMTSSIVFRSAALFLIFYQVRLIASDLANTPVFTAALLSGFAVAVFFSILRVNNKHVNCAAVIISIALVPLVSRTLIAIPRLFIPESTGAAAIALDSLLLDIDRNNFVSLFPFYWIAVSTWFSIRSRMFLRAAIIADAAVLLFIFSAAHTAEIEIYRWPVVMIIVFAAIVFLQALALLFSMPPRVKLQAREICFAAASFLIIISLCGFLFLKPFQERAAEMGGGLLEPKLFNFDFSKFLKLDSEISMNNDLILIVKKENDDNILLRRSVLSGYNNKQGFHIIEFFDEKNHPQHLPDRQVILEPPVFDKARYSFQEYFFVNFNASAFIGKKEPVVISPYENWDVSSFNSAYAVKSLVSSADSWDLYNSTDEGEHLAPAQLGLSEAEYKIYTEFGNDERLRALALNITLEYDRYAEKVSAVYNFLKYGDYRYSLKPGIAADGDQLGRFLFQTKKGYCTYYAFAMTLLLRSLGIPARVAAGFFVDPQTNTFDYYPVRSNMAHAWVEVAFPHLGWIEFDPTTEILAEDEDFLFSAGADPALFERLMLEILENRSELRIKEGADRGKSGSDFNLLTRNIVPFFYNYWYYILATVSAGLFICIRCGVFLSVFMTRNERKKTIRIMRHSCRRLRLAGLRRDPALSESEWALALDVRFNGIYLLYQSAAAARFAPVFSMRDYYMQRENYGKFCVSYNNQVPLWRRIMAWILPPLAFILKPVLRKSDGIMRNCNKNCRVLMIIFLLVCASDPRTRAQNENEADLTENEYLPGADELYHEASNADFAEQWERAIELYREGGKRFPDDARFPWALGNLYYDRSLYSLSWEEYRKAEAIIPDNHAILLRLARNAGYLNRNSAAVDYYERVLEIDPDDREAIGSLGWMYFKVHRLEDGEKLLLSALDRFGDEPDFSMTLGTIYSDMFRYDDSRFWYKKAIALGEDIGDRLFTSVAWYNLSILESRFYRYDLCMDATNSSLGIQKRASGHIARGELYKRRLDLEKAQAEFETAYELDTSPLAKLNLAQIYQVSGRLEEARLYAEDCLKRNDNSWMFNYGIDPERYKRDIHLILYETYSALAETERLTPRTKLYDKIRSLFKTIMYKLKYEVNLRLYRKYCLAAANAYTGGSQASGRPGKTISEDMPHLDSYIQYGNAFKAYPRRSLAYLNMARAFETVLIPAAIPSYNYKEGTLMGSEYLTEKALYGFDPVWESELIALCYSELAKSKNRKIFSQSGWNPDIAAEELFALNRGALRQKGIKLPVQINIVFYEETPVSMAVNPKKHLERGLARAGFKKASGTVRYMLNIKIDGSKANGYTAVTELTDNTGTLNKLQYSLPLRATTRADCFNLAGMLGNKIFTVE